MHLGRGVYPSMHLGRGCVDTEGGHGGVCLQRCGWGMWTGGFGRGVDRSPPPDTMGYGQQVGSMHPTRMLSCTGWIFGTFRLVDTCYWLPKRCFWFSRLLCIVSNIGGWCKYRKVTTLKVGYNQRWGPMPQCFQSKKVTIPECWLLVMIGIHDWMF